MKENKLCYLNIMIKINIHKIIKIVSLYLIMLLLLISVNATNVGSSQ